MNISLPSQMQAFLEAEVASGKYATTSEAVRDAIRLLQERKAERLARLAQIRKSVAVGIRQAERGEFSDLDIKEIIAKAKAERKRRLRA